MKSPVAETKDRRRAGFAFRSDQLCLDFVATVAERDTADIEKLHTGDDLRTWFYVAGLPPSFDTVADEELDRARGLREAVNQLVRARVDGARPDTGDIAVVNRAAAFGTPHLRLSLDGKTAVPAEPAEVDAVLSIIARDAVELFSGAYGDRLRRCLGHDCSLYFVDRSRKGIRRWCSMAACGEKASSAAYRRRLATTPAAR